MFKRVILLASAILLGTALSAQERGIFCGAVGTEGCDAIAQDSNIIVAWATGCTVARGPVDIVNPDGPRVHYGTPFDLAELADSTGINIDSIVYVLLVDVVGTIDPQYATYDAYGHIVNDPYPTNDTQWDSGGFDLTGMAVIHENSPSGVEQVPSVIAGIWPLPATDHINVECHQAQIDIQILDINGRTMQSEVLHQGVNSIDISAFPTGIYLLRTEGTTKKIVKR